VPGWLRTSLVITAVVGGALLLWVGFALLVAILLIAALPVWLWSLVKRRRAPQGPVTLEGAATRVDEPAVLAPLTEEEQALLAATPVWVVWYEDQFHVGAERDSFGVGVCFSEDEAKAFIARSGGKMLTPGYDGYQILGPENPLTTPLFGAQRAVIVGEILDRLRRNSREPIPMRI
jgi:hypothetical protein